MPPSELPIISIASYVSPALDSKSVELRKQTSATLHNACMNYGFFYLNISSFVNESETDELIRSAREFYALPQEDKDRLSLKNEDHARGYARLNENVTFGKPDAHEGLDFYRPVDNPDKSKPLWGSNQWPLVPGFRDKYEQWIEKMKVLGLIVMEAMSIGLGMSPEEWDDIRSKVDDSFWVMRVISITPDYLRTMTAYRAERTSEVLLDYGCLTFLLADPTPSALQVYLHDKSSRSDVLGSSRNLKGGTWINADPIPGCVVCNIGEMWELWTKGLYKSTLHRVIHRGPNDRISVPFFFEPNFDALVAPLPAALRLLDAREKEQLDGSRYDGAIPRKPYEPVVYGEFLMKKVGSNFATGKGKYV